MDQFKKYVNQLFNWNKEMKDFLASEKVEENSELWEKLDQFTGLIEGVSSPLSDQELVDLQTKAETIHSDLENYFKRKQNIGDIWIEESVIPPGKHVLPELSYSYDALEPYISKEIMELHHKKHHRAYIDGLNKAELELKAARKNNHFSLIKHWTRELSFHGSGHYLHTIFWKNMSPHGGGNPTGQLLKDIESYFGNLNYFQHHFTEAAKQVEGNGWAVLVWAPRARHLEILQTEKHMNMTQWDTIPILVLDVWEHAYYLQYKNNREEYIKNWWKVVNWNDVEMRFDRAREVKWQPF